MEKNFGRPEPHMNIHATTHRHTHTHTHTHTQICEGVVKMILKEISWEGRSRIDDTGELLSMW